MLGALVFLLTVYFYFSPHRYISIFLLFVLMTGGFQLIPLSLMTISGAGISKTYDWGLLFTGVIALVKPQVFLDAGVWRRFKLVFLYGLFLLVLLWYSIYVRDVEPSVSVRVFRSLIYFITLFVLVPLSQPELEKVFKLIIVFTSLASLVYCLQLVVHKELLNRVSSDVVGLNDTGTWARYYNLPVFVYPVLFFLFFRKHVFAVKFRMVLLLLNGLAIVLSQHRNLIVSVLICYGLYLLLNSRLKLWNLMLYACMGVGLILGADSMGDNRFSAGMQDISRASMNFSTINFYEVNMNDLSTTEFRRLLLTERLDYILKDHTASVLGLGLITDDSRKAQRLNFNIGIADEYGDITQVASGDIVWSVLLLQLGLAGTFLFILVHLSFLIKFFSRMPDPYMQVGILYLVCLFITSFYSNTIMLPYITSLVMLFCAYYYNLVRSNALELEYGIN